MIPLTHTNLVGVTEGVGVGVFVNVGVIVGVCVGVFVKVGVTVGVCVGVLVTVGVIVLVGVIDGVGGTPPQSESEEHELPGVTIIAVGETYPPVTPYLNLTLVDASVQTLIVTDESGFNT